MKRIGLTGGIGSGKTTVARIFKLLDIPVYNSDEQARILTDSDPDIKTAILNQFGAEVFSSDGKLNRAALANIVFNNPDSLHSLNAIIHPAVAHDFEKWCSQQNAAFIIKEAAIIFEHQLEKHLDGVIVVEAPDDLRIKRVMKRNASTEAEVRARMQQQFPQENLVRMADWVIHNDEKQLLIPQVLHIYSQILAG
ncbi:MAG TPA: dephospho-CoA kinase [Flavobacteriales bacterium]|nr:dephospho-CoA kinase [Flavobacteriales bacterium]